MSGTRLDPTHEYPEAGQPGSPGEAREVAADPTDQYPEAGQPEAPGGAGPLAGAEPDTGRPIDDPALADRANPRWDDPSEPRPDAEPLGEAPGAQPLANPDGTPNVMPAGHVEMPIPEPGELEAGTPQDQAARPIESEIGRDTIRQGLGGGTANPALAEGGEAGEGS